MTTSDDENYVGHGHPPKYRQWKRGQSGNSRGRPPGSKNRKTMVTEVALEVHKVREQGRSRNRTTLDLVVRTVCNLALEGKPGAFPYFKDLDAKYSGDRSVSSGGLLVAPAEMSQEDWVKAMEEANKTKSRPTIFDGS